MFTSLRKMSSSLIFHSVLLIVICLVSSNMLGFNGDGNVNKTQMLVESEAVFLAKK